MRIIIFHIFILAAQLIKPQSTSAAVTEFWNRAVWQNAAGNHAVITFQGFSEPVFITDQYASQGVFFADGNDVLEFNNSFLNDGVGLLSNELIVGEIRMIFDQPIVAIAADFVGRIDFLLYSDGQLIYDSAEFSTVGSRFGGVVSTSPFDSVVIRDPGDGVVAIDDLYFGPPVPGPGAMGLVAVAVLMSSRRRR